jgi:hypothetical protein
MSFTHPFRDFLRCIEQEAFKSRPRTRIVPFDPALLYNDERHSRRAHGGSAGPSQRFRARRVRLFAHNFVITRQQHN